MKSFGGLAFTRPSGQATYLPPNKRPFGNKPDSLPTEPFKRSEREEAIHLRAGCFTCALERRGKLSSIRQISRTRDRGRANHLLVPFFAAPDQKIIYFLRFRVPLRHLS